MAVKNVRLEDDAFIVELKGVGWSILYAFPVKELEQGASLSRMMNLKVRETLNTYEGMVSKEELRAVSKEGVAALRKVIEPYFESRGIGA